LLCDAEPRIDDVIIQQILLSRYLRRVGWPVVPMTILDYSVRRDLRDFAVQLGHFT